MLNQMPSVSELFISNDGMNICLISLIRLVMLISLTKFQEFGSCEGALLLIDAEGGRHNDMATGLLAGTPDSSVINKIDLMLMLIEFLT